MAIIDWSLRRFGCARQDHSYDEFLKRVRAPGMKVTAARTAYKWKDRA